MALETRLSYARCGKIVYDRERRIRRENLVLMGISTALDMMYADAAESI